MKKVISSLLIGVWILSLSCVLIGCKSSSQNLPDDKNNDVVGNEEPTQVPNSDTEDKDGVETITHDEAVTLSMQLSSAMETNTEYVSYYGGCYVDNAKVIVLLTEMNNEFISFCKNYVGENASYELCQASLAELTGIRDHINDYLRNYVKSDEKEINDMVDSIVSTGTYIMDNKVFVEMIDCTDEKIKLFNLHIVNSEHILFENTDDYVELQ